MGEMNGNMVLQHNQAQHNLSYKSKQRQKEFWTERTTLTRVRMPNPDPEKKWSKLSTKNAEQKKDGEKLGQSPYSRITNERYHMYLWGTKSPGLFVRTINAEGKEESFRPVAELSKECGAVRMEFSKSEDDSYAAKSDRFKMSTLGKRNFSYKGFLKLKNINLSFTTSLATPSGGRYDILEWTRSINYIDQSDGTQIGKPQYYNYGSMIVYSNPQGEPEYIENIYREFSDDREWEYMGAGAWYGTVGNDLVMAFPDHSVNGEFYSGRLEKLKFVRNSTANVVWYIRLTEEGQLANTAFEFPENQYFNLNSSLSMQGFRFGSAPLKAVFSGTMVGFNIGWHNILLELE